MVVDGGGVETGICRTRNKASFTVMLFAFHESLDAFLDCYAVAQGHC
ncbi:hypothetical protein [uncultured Corynebacterium sp.]|nr:hypothetical protein [uncultured Corynebacterium sp.]